MKDFNLWLRLLGQSLYLLVVIYFIPFIVLFIVLSIFPLNYAVHNSVLLLYAYFCGVYTTIRLDVWVKKHVT